MAVWNRITALVAGGALSRSAGTALDPVFETTRQRAWGERAVRTLDPSIAADAKSQNLHDELDFTSLKADGTTTEQASSWPGTEVNFQDDAKRHGVGQARFNLLWQMQQAVPGLPDALALWRRRRIPEATVDAILKRHGYVDGVRPALKDLKNLLLDPGQLAAAIHRGLVPDPGDVPGGTPLLKGQQPEPPFNVEAYPVYPINALREAEGSGYDRDRLGVLVGLQGLPMGVIEAAQAFYRGILTKGDYIRAFNESNNRNEWADAVLQYAKQIPTARDYIENALRGYRTLAKAQEGAARHGMSPEDALLIFQNSGRPLNLKQITQAQAWGGKYQPAKDDNPDPWVQAVLLGAVRPEYYNLQEHLKYNLPSALYFRTLQTQGVLTEAEAVTWYKRLGWPPDLAEKVAAAFAKPTGAKADPYVTKAETQLWNATHRSYLAGEADEATALGMLDVLGLDLAAKSAVIGLWTNERTLRSKQLTAAQIKKAWRRPVINPATGRAWSFEDAVQALVALGYSLNDANTFLAE